MVFRANVECSFIHSVFGIWTSSHFQPPTTITPTYFLNSHSCMIIMQAARIIAICVPITAALWSALHVLRDSGMELAVINSVNNVSIHIYKVEFFSFLNSR